MDFSAALTELKAGTKMRRHAWAGSHRGLTVELAQPSLYDGRKLMPQLLVTGEDNVLRPFTGAALDLLADDWEVAPAPGVQA